MGRRTEEALIPARFLTTLGHFLAVLILAGSKATVVNAGLAGGQPSADDIAAANSEVNGALIFALFCFLLDFAGLGFGFSAFMPKVNALQILVHFAGGVLTSRLVVEEWDYRVFWYIVALCNVPAAITELLVLALIFGLKVYSY
eukprot:TRINITY_DN14074_c0_g1_i2.p1 TRINITY_DN14074_c0_g1~~TRINITY_DN14074_c0_g1_i2.p1  ORF type:complete len:158 (-),score=40.06 TRINITY_DN14074_c0_g1_i2:446-877(-)